MEKHPACKKEVPASEKKVDLAAQKLLTHLKDLIKKRYKTFRAFAAAIDIDPGQLTNLLKGSNLKVVTLFRCYRGLKIQPATHVHMALSGYYDFTEETDMGWETKKRGFRPAAKSRPGKVNGARKVQVGKRIKKKKRKKELTENSGEFM